MPISERSNYRNKLSTIILAAGIGKRMYSKTPKILHTILGKPIISFVIDLAKAIQSDEIIIVVGKHGREIKKIIGSGVTYALQAVPQGTGDAAKRGIALSSNRDVLILCGDVPFLTKKTLMKLMAYHAKEYSDITILTCEVKNPSGYGRIIHDTKNRITGIIEQTDATRRQQAIKEINTGVYYGKRTVIASALNEITSLNRQGEYYLTDIVRTLIKRRKKIARVKIKNEEEILGINSKLDLSHACELCKKRWFEELTARGVFIEDPITTTIDLSVQIGTNVHIRPFTLIEGKTKIKDGAIIGPFVWIKNGKKMKSKARM